ncbi:MAG: tRNA (adenosine(37)-N6)-threonylcarbamoyltransferase complex dimerization subunit type 1 TsaB [Anaerolineaceae bacterium]|jgi:tRNA threonylcarbamoyladenosine biosynthesis protein TsaB|nr:tRNA (adenosine(37)-N6)-threonylcarbamoyltransferase complex dimerization subunit type 1 TsaB [Anaerolineaceae bacterium]
MLLAIDSSTQTVGIALFDGSQVIGEIIWQTRSHHTVELSPAIDELFKKCRINYEQLKGLAIAAGPGSFTSLRIGFAIVKGLALALHIPAVAIPTLDILVAAQPLRDIPMYALLQSGRNRYALGKYTHHAKGWMPEGEIVIKKIDEISEMVTSPTMLCGELLTDDRHFLLKNNKNFILASPVQSLRRPSYLAYLAWKKLKTGKLDDVRFLSPIYIHIANPIL